KAASWKRTEPSLAAKSVRKKGDRTLGFRSPVPFFPNALSVGPRTGPPLPRPDLPKACRAAHDKGGPCQERPAALETPTSSVTRCRSGQPTASLRPGERPGLACGTVAGP